MRKTSPLMLALLVTLPLVAAPAVSAETAATAGQAEKPAKEKKICRAETNTGSIMPKRTCRLASEWAVLDKQTTDSVENSRNSSNPLGTQPMPGQQLR